MRYVYKQHHYRNYLITLSATITLVGAVVFGSLGTVVDADRGHFVQPGIRRSQTTSTTKPGTTTTIIPATTPAASAPTPTAPSPSTTTPVTKAPVVTSQPVAPPAPPDTAAASQTTTAAQASTTALAQPVTYENHQLSPAMRNQLIQIASVVGFVGLTLYSLTLIRRPKPVSIAHRIPVEVVTR